METEIVSHQFTQLTRHKPRPKQLTLKANLRHNHLPTISLILLLFQWPPTSCTVCIVIQLSPGLRRCRGFLEGFELAFQKVELHFCRGDLRCECGALLVYIFHHDW